MLLSGGVDSTVCAALLSKALQPNQMIPLHIDNGLMRKNESQLVIESLKSIGVQVRLLNAQLQFAAGTTTHKVPISEADCVTSDGGGGSGATAAEDMMCNVPIGPLNQCVTNSEEKRKIIGDTFMKVTQKFWENSGLKKEEILLGQGEFCMIFLHVKTKEMP